MGADKKYAAVTSLGASGTNCHVVLAKAPAAEEYRLPAPRIGHPILISGKTKEVLRNNIKALHAHLKADADRISLEDISYTLIKGRKHYDYRFSTVVYDVEACLAELEAYLMRRPRLIIKRPLRLS